MKTINEKRILQTMRNSQAISAMLPSSHTRKPLPDIVEKYVNEIDLSFIGKLRAKRANVFYNFGANCAAN